MTAQAGVSFDVTIPNHDEVRVALERLAWAVANIDPALEEIGASQLTEVQWRFENQQGPDGAPWKVLADVTKKRHPSGNDAKVLRRSGELYDSYTYKVASGEGVRVGSNKIYARIHQLGGQAGRGLKTTIPARPALGLSNAGRAEILAILTEHMESVHA